AAMGDQSIDEGSVQVARRRMDDHAGGLVDDDQMCILKADIERDRLSDRRRIFSFGENYDEILAAAHPPRRVAKRYTLMSDVTLLNQMFESRPRQCWKMQGQRAVETQSDLGRTGANRDRGIRAPDRGPRVRR